MTTIAIGVVLGCAVLAALLEWLRQEDMDWSGSAILMGGFAGWIGGPWWAMGFALAGLVGSLQDGLGSLLVLGMVVFAIGLHSDWQWARDLEADMHLLRARAMLAMVLP